MNEVCMVPWRLLDSRSEQLPRGVSSRAGAFIWEIPVASCGGVEPGSCRHLPADLSCHGCHARKDPCPLPHSRSREQMDGKAHPTLWEGNKDLSIVPDAWLLPLPTVEWAGSSKTTVSQFLGVRADKRAHGACYKARLEVAQSQGVQQAMQHDQWSALCPLSCSPSTNVFVSLSEWCSGVGPGSSSTSAQCGGGVEITGYGCKMETDRQSVVMSFQLPSVFQVPPSVI